MRLPVRRWLCVAFALLFAVSAFAGCGKKPKETAESSQTTEPVTKMEWGDDLPSSLDFGGTDFHVYAWQETQESDWQSEMSSDIINQAVWRSREEVADRLNVSFDISFTPGNWDNRNTFVSNLKTYMMSGMQFDLVGQYTPTAAVGAMEGLYTDLSALPYLNFHSVYWPGNFLESCNIGNRVYFCSGDITQSLITQLGVMYINLDLWEDMGISENIYELVESREWTMETMQSLLLGRIGISDDVASQKYGLQMEGRIVYDNLFYAAGLNWVTHEEDGTLFLSEEITATKAGEWYETCHKLLWENADVCSQDDPRYGANDPRYGITIADTFMAGKSIAFMALNLNSAKTYVRDASFDFAVVPYPLYNSEQTDYHSITGYSVSMFSVPTTFQSASMSGAVLEALGSSGYRNITPKVYDQSFRQRFLQTEENARMLDLIHDSVTYDTGRIFADDIAVFNMYRNAFYNTYSWTTLYTGRHETWEANVEKVNNKLGG